jgi:hypothetical protein
MRAISESFREQAKRRKVMKKNSIRVLTITVAALTVGAAAYAQTRMIAEVPFSFHINGTVLPAGNYSVGPMSAGSLHTLVLSDKHTNKAAVALVSSTTEGERDRPRLVFRCGDVSGCYLIQVWDNQGFGWELPKPRLTAAEKERVAVVPIRRSEARTAD